MTALNSGLPEICKSRWDMPGGDGEQLIQSIQTKLMTLPDDTLVLPGHGPETTIGAERKGNPFLQEG